MSDEVKVPECQSELTYDVVEDSLNRLWGVINELSYIRPPVKKFFRVSIFGSARVKPGQKTFEDSRELARVLAEAGCDIVTGGGPGVMEAANEGENLGDPEGKTRSIGLPVELPHEDSANPFVEKIYHHRTFFSRLHQFVRLSSAFVVVEGGIGTTLELLMVWQLIQVRHVDNTPLILVGPMWRGLVEWARASMLSHDPPLASASDLELPICVDTIEEATAIILAHKAKFDAAHSADGDGQGAS